MILQISEQFNYRAVGKARVRKRRAKEKSATVENRDAVVFYLGAWNEREWEHEREAGEWTTLWRESRPMPVSAASQPAPLGRANLIVKTENNENRARRLRSRHLARFIYRRSRDFRQRASEMNDSLARLVERRCSVSRFDFTIQACMKFVREFTIGDATFIDTFFSSRDTIIFFFNTINLCIILLTKRYCILRSHPSILHRGWSTSSFANEAGQLCNFNSLIALLNDGWIGRLCGSLPRIADDKYATLEIGWRRSSMCNNSMLRFVSSVTRIRKIQRFLTKYRKVIK